MNKALAVALVFLLACPALAAAFTAAPFLQKGEGRQSLGLSHRSGEARRAAHALSLTAAMAEFQPVGAGVKKLVLEEGSGEAAQKGAQVEVEYTGTVAENGWSVEDVAECWLAAQQGMEVYSDAFIQNGVDGAKLLELTEDGLTGMGVPNRIHAKKLSAAVKRLQKQHEEVPVGAQFDSSEGKGPFAFTLGKGKVIKGWETAVASMKAGEKAQVLCRADVAYGAEGLRKKTGEVVVPPFATLLFDMKLIKC